MSRIFVKDAGLSFCAKKYAILKPMKAALPSKGFTLIELLIVIAVIGMLAILVLSAVNNSRLKAYDSSIRSDVTQIRWLTEIAFDDQGGTYVNWTANPNIQSQLTVALDDIDKYESDPVGPPYTTVMRDTQANEYCVSAPLRTEPKYYCVDATAVFKTVSTPCPTDTGAPLRCPAS
jgi:prepilin-type N-terminal cleavage/methylation domain-containing protein